MKAGPWRWLRGKKACFESPDLRPHLEPGMVACIGDHSPGGGAEKAGWNLGFQRPVSLASWWASHLGRDVASKKSVENNRGSHWCWLLISTCACMGKCMRTRAHIHADTPHSHPYTYIFRHKCTHTQTHEGRTVMLVLVFFRHTELSDSLEIQTRPDMSCKRFSSVVQCEAL